MRNAIFCGACFLILAGAGVAPQAEEDHPDRAWDGSRTTPVHRLNLRDEAGESIVPEYRRSLPFSARQTCGPCHEYEKVSSGWHFNSGDPSVAPGRSGEPWVWVDTATGTQIPVSSRGWPGAWKPEDLGLTPWRFTQLFARHSAGADFGEPEDELADPEARWEVSGVLEANCLGCHSASPRQDQSEWAKQVLRENLRWAATAASGMGDVGGMASRVPDTWTVYDGPNPDDTQYAVPPYVRYDQTQFDSKHRLWFDIDHKPQDRRCLYCHSVSRVDGPEKWETPGDVHSAAGLLCADCHRNGLDHNIIRGYDTEGGERGEPAVAAFSCDGCHSGAYLAEDKVGALGAPVPEHKGLAIVHFEKLSCTACHSGPWPERTPARVRTSRANRTGIHGRAQWFTDAPHIVEPVFMKGADGKIAPHRMMWPAFWARVDGGKVVPLDPEHVAEKAAGLFEVDKQVGDVLAALATMPDVNGTPVFVTKGKVYRRNIDGGLDVSDYSGTRTVSAVLWGLATEKWFRPLVEDFDPALEELDAGCEVAIENVLRALTDLAGPNAAAILTNGPKAFRLDENGYVEAIDNPAEPQDGLAWRILREDRVDPLIPPRIVRWIAATAGSEKVLVEEQVAAVLLSLAGGDEKAARSFAYISAGKMFRLHPTGATIALDHPAAQAVTWPLGHDVRPAAQSLGAKACEDCHAKDAPFFFGKIRAAGPLKTNNVAELTMRSLQGTDAEIYLHTSQVFKWFIIGTMALLLLHIAGDLTRRALRKRKA